jgi:aryl-alcohol dehydrogenase-like predicted oxidoreductase
MLYTRLGNTGLIVSRLAFGAMTFGTGEKVNKAISKLDQAGAKDLIAQSIDAGVNFFNTADAYSGGQSEEMLGKALGSRRQDVVIATKVGFRTGDALVNTGLSRQHIFNAVEGSLRRLGTDYIDVYLVHRFDPYTPLEETLSALDDIVHQGKVRYIGYSNWPAWYSAKAVGLQREHGWARFVAAEVYYSLLGRDLEHEVVPFAEDAGIGIMVWSPLAGGFLTGKYTREDPTGDSGRLSGFNVIPFDREWGFKVVDQLKEIATGHKVTPAQVALAWLLSKSHVASILVGASKSNQLASNLEAANLVLKVEELQSLDELTAPTLIYPNWFKQNIFDSAVRSALGEE